MRFEYPIQIGAIYTSRGLGTISFYVFPKKVEYVFQSHPYSKKKRNQTLTIYIISLENYISSGPLTQQPKHGPTEEKEEEWSLQLRLVLSLL